MCGLFAMWGLKKFLKDKSAIATGQVVGIVLSLFVVGAMLPSAVTMVSNITAYADADSNVALICYMVLPMIAVIAIALAYLRRR